MAKLTGGDILVRVLADHGVRYVFSIIGGQMCSVYEAVRVHPEMELVTLRNETSVPIMASGYTAASGIPAVSMCTVGAGVVYEVAGLMYAWFNYFPVISISPQVQSWKMKPHQENLQGCNQDEIFEPVTKWNAIVYHWDRIPQMVNRAMREAQANAPGPVHLDVPVDVLFKSRKLTPKAAAKIMPPARTTRFSGALPGVREKVEAGVKSIAGSKKPVALMGQGMGRPGRYEKLRDRLNALGIPVLSSTTSSCAMSGADPGYCGLIGPYADCESARAVLAESDMLLVLGVDPEIMDLINSLKGFSGVIVQVEVDPSAILNSLPSHVGVNADPVSFLEEMDAKYGRWDAWTTRVKEAGNSIIDAAKEKSPDAAKLFEGLALSLTENDVIVMDGATSRETAELFLGRTVYKRLFIMNSRYMAGPGLPFAIGARLALPDNPTTLITDKDSLFRHLQELQTAVALCLNLQIVVLDPGEGKDYARTEAVFRGLGCDVQSLKPGEAPGEGKKSLPSVWLVQRY